MIKEIACNLFYKKEEISHFQLCDLDTRCYILHISPFLLQSTTQRYEHFEKNYLQEKCTISKFLSMIKTDFKKQKSIAKTFQILMLATPKRTTGFTLIDF